MMFKSKKRSRSVSRRMLSRKQVLSCETLESRTMLAGDVDVSIVRGDLILRGDAADNAVDIAPAEGGGVAVTGKDGTRINGRTEPLVVFQDQKRIPDDLQLRFHRGSNRISVSNILVGDDIYADSGQGQDEYTFDGVSANDRFQVHTGSGDDRVLINGNGVQSAIARNIYVYATAGDNAVGINDVAVRGDIFMRTGRGDDVLSTKNARIDDDLRIYSSTGDDTVAVLDSVISDDTTLEAGPRYSFSRTGSNDADSAIILNSTHRDRANIYLGSDSDFIGIQEAEIGDRVDLSAGSGFDEVGVRRSLFTSRVSIDGGSGNNGLLAEANSFARDPQLREFDRGVENFDDRLDAILDKLADAGLLGEQLDSITQLVVENDEFSTLEAAVVAAGLADTLNEDGDFTVFAPTNAAFDALPDGALDALLADPEGQLKDILLYHAAGEEIFAEDIVQRTNVETLLGSRIKVAVTPGGVVLNDTVNVTATDIPASNGVIHVIDAVLMPPGSITEIVVGSDDFSTLEAAVVAAGLADTLNEDGEFTVVAPTNAAFDTLPDGTLEALLADPDGQLTDILLYHVANESAFAEDVVQLPRVPTLLDIPVAVEVTQDGVVLNGSVNVSMTDIIASNGVIHVIDAVLIPPGSITDIVVGSDEFSTLEAAVVAAGLAETLDSEGSFTVFAPTNAAFDKLPAGTIDSLLADPQGRLRDILLYHATDTELFSEDVVSVESIDTLLGESIDVRVTNQGVVLNESVLVTATDIIASNGVIHVIDTVLLPPETSEQSIAEIVATNGNFDTLRAALETGNLTDTLDSDGSFTVFAPTDDAFDKLPSQLLTVLTRFAPEILRNILLYHVVDTPLSSEDIIQSDSVRTLLGRNVSIDVNGGDVILNNRVRVTVTDIQATNGVIHVIDTVLLPVRFFR